MQFPESWLREFCNPSISSRELADLLTMSGLEVEEQRPVAPPFSGVVVAMIVEAAPHPSADRLQVCMVDAGVPPGRFARVWLHTHPGASVEPSHVDEETFGRGFGGCDWVKF